jgi:alpha-ribazole phosphatase
MTHSLQAWVVAWRHPRPQGAEGRCIGRTDLPVDRRKARRLAHRIRMAARRHGWPHVVHTSSLQRCAAVGRVLRSWGWRHVVDDALIEADFGAWDGCPWSAIPWGEVDAWCANFTDHAPGGGEPLRAVLARAAQWPTSLLSIDALTAAPRLLVAHAGWMLARRWQLEHPRPPVQAAQWPRPPRYGDCWSLGAGASAAGATASVVSLAVSSP